MSIHDRTHRVQAARVPAARGTYATIGASASRDSCPTCAAAVFENACVKVASTTAAPLLDPGSVYRATCRRCKAVLVRAGAGSWTLMGADELGVSRFIGPQPTSPVDQASWRLRGQIGVKPRDTP